MQLTVVGCGDAFGAGNRLQTCYFVRSETSTFLIDCGATTLIGLNRLGLSPNDIDTVYVSHLHGDHIGDNHTSAVNAGTCAEPDVSIVAAPASSAATTARGRS